jgi:hypothetical protein
MNRHSERGGKSPLRMRRNNGVGAPDTDSFFHHLFVFFITPPSSHRDPSTSRARRLRADRIRALFPSSQPLAPQRRSATVNYRMPCNVCMSLSILLALLHTPGGTAKGICGSPDSDAVLPDSFLGGSARRLRRKPPCMPFHFWDCRNLFCPPLSTQGPRRDRDDGRSSLSVLLFLTPLSYPDGESRRLLLSKRSVLSSRPHFSFKGAAECLEDLLARIVPSMTLDSETVGNVLQWYRFRHPTIYQLHMSSQGI